MIKIKSVNIVQIIVSKNLQVFQMELSIFNVNAIKITADLRLKFKINLYIYIYFCLF